MSHVIEIELNDEAYAVVQRNAEREGINPEAFIERIIGRLPSGIVYDDPDEFSRSLGDTDEEIAEAKLLADKMFPPDDAISENN